MQEFLLLALITALSPVSTQCADQEEVEQVEEEEEEEEDVRGQDEASAPEDMRMASQNQAPAQSAASETESIEDSSAPNAYGFGNEEFNNSKEETGTKSIFQPDAFLTTEGVQPSPAA